MRKLAISAVLALAALGLAAPAGAATHPSYPLGHKAHCRAHYVSKVRHHRVHGKLVAYRECVYRPPVKVTPPTPPTLPVTATAPTIQLRAQLDPSFVQGPGPLDVTYSFSASAETYTNGVGALDQSLPDGVLNLFTPTTPGGPSGLACSVDVGGDTNGGTCDVTYADTGTFDVTVVYDSGTSSATETDSETILPYPTSITASVVAGPPPLSWIVSAGVTLGDGTTVSPPALSLSFSIYNGATGDPVGPFTTETAGQTSCEIDIVSGALPDDPSYVTVMSPDCSGSVVLWDFSFEDASVSYSAAFDAPGYVPSATGELVGG
jgi:hypothetical protein